MENALQTCLEMFQQRGYNVIDYDDDRINAIKQDGKPICAFMAETPKFNVNRVQEYIAFMSELQIHHGIIVYKDNATPMAKKVINNSLDIIIELFTEEELQYNITKHRLVPKHEKLSSKEAIKFVEKFGKNFPIIQLSDPISRFYGYKRGDIIKVTRKNEIIFRIVKG